MRARANRLSVVLPVGLHPPGASPSPSTNMSKETLTVSGTLRVRHTRQAGSGTTALPVVAPMPRVAVRALAKHLGVWRELGNL